MVLMKLAVYFVHILIVHSSAINWEKRILAGHNSSPRPFYVYLEIVNNETSEGKDSTTTCGGTVVAENFILTSGSCLDRAKKVLPKPKTQWESVLRSR